MHNTNNIFELNKEYLISFNNNSINSKDSEEVID